MKTRICLAALALLAVSCSKNESTDAPETPVNAKAIQLGQTVQGMTRAAVGPGSNVTATVVMCDGVSADWSSYAAIKNNEISNSNTLDTRATASTASFKAGTSTSIALQPTLYYHTDGSTNSWLAAVAPDGNLAASGTVVTMKSTDGQQDVMWATAVTAGAGNSVSSPNLSFSHLTTQLNFAVEMTDESPGEWDGKTVMIKGISIQNTQLPQSVNAADGIVVWSTAASLAVPNISGVSLNGTASSIGNPVMVKGEGKVVIDVTLLVGGQELNITNVTIKKKSTTDDLTTATGSAHLITLNVKEPAKPSTGVAITATATVAAWKTGAEGSADLN